MIICSITDISKVSCYVMVISCAYENRVSTQSLLKVAVVILK